jgi:hypothetical protein
VKKVFCGVAYLMLNSHPGAWLRKELPEYQLSGANGKTDHLIKPQRLEFDRRIKSGPEQLC